MMAGTPRVVNGVTVEQASLDYLLALDVGKMNLRLDDGSTFFGFLVKYQEKLYEELPITMFLWMVKDITVEQLCLCYTAFKRGSHPRIINASQHIGISCMIMPVPTPKGVRMSDSITVHIYDLYDLAKELCMINKSSVFEINIAFNHNDASRLTRIISNQWNSVCKKGVALWTPVLRRFKLEWGRYV